MRLTEAGRGAGAWGGKACLRGREVASLPPPGPGGGGLESVPEGMIQRLRPVSRNRALEWASQAGLASLKAPKHTWGSGPGSHQSTVIGWAQLEQRHGGWTVLQEGERSFLKALPAHSPGTSGGWRGSRAVATEYSIH